MPANTKPRPLLALHLLAKMGSAEKITAGIMQVEYFQTKSFCRQILQMLHRPAKIKEYIQLQYLLDGPEQTPPLRPGPHKVLRPPLSLGLFDPRNPDPVIPQEAC